jgi:hypothetical protein
MSVQDVTSWKTLGVYCFWQIEKMCDFVDSQKKAPSLQFLGATFTSIIEQFGISFRGWAFQFGGDFYFFLFYLFIYLFIFLFHFIESSQHWFWLLNDQKRDTSWNDMFRLHLEIYFSDSE